MKNWRYKKRNATEGKIVGVLISQAFHYRMQTILNAKDTDGKRTVKETLTDSCCHKYLHASGLPVMFS